MPRHSLAIILLSWLLPLFVVAGAFLPVEVPGAESVRLNAPDTHVSSGASLTLRISHDGRWVNFAEGFPQEGYRVPIGGGEIQRITAPLPPDKYVRRMELTPDDGHVIYQTRAYGGDDGALFRAPFAGGPAVTLSADSADVYSFELNSPGSHILYQAESGVFGHHDAFTVPAGGGAATEVAGYALGFSSDGRFVLYADRFSEPSAVYQVSPGAGMPVKLSADFGPTGSVYLFSIQSSPDSRSVVYQARGEPFDPLDLYSVDINGGPSTLLNDPAHGTHLPFVTPDSRRVVYFASPPEDAPWDLYSVPISGGNPVRLNHEIASNQYLSPPISSPDSSRIAFTVNQTLEQCNFGSVLASELYSVPVDGGTSTLLSRTIESSLDDPRTVWNPQFTADGSHVLYLDGYAGCGAGATEFDLLSIPTAGGDPARLSFAQENGLSGVRSFALSPDGYWAVFVQQIAPGDRSEAVFAVPVAGGSPQQVSQPVPLGSDVVDHELLFSPDGRYLVYRQSDTYEAAETFSRARTNLYSVRMPVVPEPTGISLVLAAAMLLGLTRRSTHRAG